MVFRVFPHEWFQTTKEEIYFITRLSRRGEKFPWFPKVLAGVETVTELVYVQRYVDPDILDPNKF